MGASKLMKHVLKDTYEDLNDRQLYRELTFLTVIPATYIKYF